jgi:hypothetical protein
VLLLPWMNVQSICGPITHRSEDRSYCEFDLRDTPRIGLHQVVSEQGKISLHESEDLQQPRARSAQKVPEERTRRIPKD